MSKRFPYQPSLPMPKTVSPPVSLGYPAPKPAWYKTIKETQDATALLKEVGVENFDAVNVLKLLQDEERLKVVVKKLKLKAFL